MSNRPETGLMQFGDDWTGVFIRGDTAAGYFMALRQLLDGEDDGLVRLQVEGLLSFLGGSNEQGHDEETRKQVLRPWAECLPPDHEKRLQLSFDSRLRENLGYHGFEFISKDVGRDAKGVYMNVGAFSQDGVVMTRKVYKLEGWGFWSDNMVTSIGLAFLRD